MELLDSLLLGFLHKFQLFWTDCCIFSRHRSEKIGDLGNHTFLLVWVSCLHFLHTYVEATLLLLKRKYKEEDWKFIQLTKYITLVQASFRSYVLRIEKLRCAHSLR